MKRSPHCSGRGRTRLRCPCASLQTHCFGRCCACCCGGCGFACCCSCGSGRQVYYQVQSAFTAVSGRSLSPSPNSLLSLGPGSGSLQPYRHRKPVRLPFWLLARFVDGLAPSACVVRCPHGSTKRSSTTSCVCSTHHSLLALNSFLSFLQRILLALSSLLFLRAPPGPELVFPLPIAPPEPFLLSAFSS